MNLPDSSQSSSNRIIFSILLVLGFTFLGLYAGGGLSGMLVEKQNLDGMLDALGYILGGAVIGFGISLILSFKLNGKNLRRLSIVSFLIAAVISVFVYLNFAKAQQARLDPESEYENIPAYSVSLEQIVIKDPYLRVKMGSGFAETALDQHRSGTGSPKMPGHNSRQTNGADSSSIRKLGQEWRSRNRNMPSG